MASLIDLLASGIRKSDGTVCASGTVMFYTPGTLTQVAVYEDEDGTATATQPVTLDADGTTRIYTDSPVRLIVNDSDGNEVVDIARAGTEVDAEVETTSSAFSGTDLKTVLDAAETSFGGTDWKYLATTGQTEMNVKDWMTQAFANVKAFGAVGDDSTDDAAAIQAAIDYVDALDNQGVVYLPPGIYRISTPLLLATTGTSLQGAGRDATTIRNTSATGNAIEIDGVTDIFIRDMTVDNSSTSTGDNIDIATSSHIIIHNVACIEHLQGIDIDIGNAYHDIQIDNCYIGFIHDALGKGINISGDAGAYDVRITNTTIVEAGVGGLGWCVYSNGAYRHLVMLGDTFSTCDTCVFVDLTCGTVIGGCYFPNAPTTYHLDIGSTSVDYLDEWGCDYGGNTITNNLGTGSWNLCSKAYMIAPLGTAFDNQGNKAAATNITPNRYRGNTVKITMTAAPNANTIIAPSPDPAAGDAGVIENFIIVNGSGGNISLASIDASFVDAGAGDYRVDMGVVGDLGNTEYFLISFIWDGAKWRQLADEKITVA